MIIEFPILQTDGGESGLFEVVITEEQVCLGIELMIYSELYGIGVILVRFIVDKVRKAGGKA